MFQLSDLGRFVIHFGDGFRHELTLEFEAVSVVDDAIQNGVGKRRLADDVMPGLDGQLAGDHGRAAAIAFFDDLHQIASLRGSKPVRSPVVEDQQLCFRDAAEQAGEAAIAMGQFEFFEEGMPNLRPICITKPRTD